MIELDGSLGEGGGQILRTALALSLITGQACRLDNIRAKRPKPGLMRQHLACVHAAVAIGGGPAKTKAVDPQGQAVQLGDTSLCFTPGPVHSGDYTFSIDSAGSCMLVLQTVMWPLLMAEGVSQLVLRGGTHNPMAPSLSFLETLAPYLCGPETLVFAQEPRRHGFYPAGGGLVHVRLQPPAGGVAPINLMQRGALRQAHAHCLHAGLPRGVAERELAALKKALHWYDDQLHQKALRANEGPGNALLVTLVYEHISELFAAYGAKGVSAEQVAHHVAQEVQAYLTSQAPVGQYLADQLMLPMALATLRGQTSQCWVTTLSEHTRTNAQVIARFLPVDFVLEPQTDGALLCATPRGHPPSREPAETERRGLSRMNRCNPSRFEDKQHPGA